MSVDISIGILTHNHEKYIAEAIEGILIQKGDFKYEIIIVDNCSQDNTVNIIKSYQKRYSDKIIFVELTNKVSQAIAAKIIYQKANGKYIAWLDGDDYWIYENKIKYQIDFLDKNPEYSACFHDAVIKTEESSHWPIAEQAKNQYKYYSQLYNYKIDLYPENILSRCLIPTSSFVFRNRNFSSDLHLFKDISLSLNWLIFLVIAKYGKIRYINETWSVYRDHPDSITKNVEFYKFSETNILIYKRLLKDDFYRNYLVEIYHRISREYSMLLFDMENKKVAWNKRFKHVLNFLRYSLLSTLHEFIYHFFCFKGKK